MLSAAVFRLLFSYFTISTANEKPRPGDVPFPVLGQVRLHCFASANSPAGGFGL